MHGKFQLVHGKPYHYTKEVTDLGHKTDAFEFVWDEHLSLEKVKKSREAIEEFCESLRSKAHNILVEKEKPSYPAFKGPLASYQSI